jgi:hypothetical protein
MKGKARREAVSSARRRRDADRSGMGLEHERRGVSTRASRLRSFTFLPIPIAAWAAGLGGLDTAAVERSRRRAGLTARPLSIAD